MKLFLFTAALPALALASQLSSLNPLHQLGKRQTSSCPANETPCGEGCVKPGYTCCPDKAGGCPSTEYCILGNNGRYGCCPNGEHCTGAGGAHTDYSISYSTVYVTGTTTAYYTTTGVTTTSAPAPITTTTSTPVAPPTTTTTTTSADAGTSAGATSSASGPATYTGGAAGNVLNNQNGALAAVALGVVALL